MGSVFDQLDRVEKVVPVSGGEPGVGPPDRHALLVQLPHVAVPGRGGRGHSQHPARFRSRASGTSTTVCRRIRSEREHW